MSSRPEALPSSSIANRDPLPGSRKVYVAGPDGMRVPSAGYRPPQGEGGAGQWGVKRAFRLLGPAGPLHGPRSPDRPARGPPGAAAPRDPGAGGVRRAGADPPQPAGPRAPAPPAGP